ncbi:hypothetical protein ACLOJK_024790 [Asimina triloba]
MEELKLFGAFLSPFSCRVEWALKLKGVKYEYIEENLTNKSPMLLKYNPIHKEIPVLVHNGIPVIGSVLILEYIEETWKESPLLPEESYERARARFWAQFHEEKHIKAAISPGRSSADIDMAALFQCRPAIFNFFRYDGKEQEKAMAKALRCLQILEQYGLKGKKFFGGESIGFADIVIGWLAHWLEVIEEVAGTKLVTPDAFPVLNAWMKNFCNEPVIRDHLPAREGMYKYFKGRRESILASRKILSKI